MASFTSRLRHKVTGALASGDEKDLGQKVATGWLRLVGVSVDSRTGVDRPTEWLRLRAQASLNTDRSEPEPQDSGDA